MSVHFVSLGPGKKAGATPLASQAYYSFKQKNA